MGGLGVTLSSLGGFRPPGSLLQQWPSTSGFQKILENKEWSTVSHQSASCQLDVWSHPSDNSYPFPLSR